MSNIKGFLKEKKMLIIIFAILLVCSIAIAIGVYSKITNTGILPKKQETTNNYDNLKNNFDRIFTNSINIVKTTKPDLNYNELLYTRFTLEDSQSGKYTLNVNIPWFKQETDVTNKINDEILDVFGNEIVKIKNESKSSVIYSLNYVAYVNDDILSLVIMCNYKNGTNAQRKIIQCYNYDIVNDRLLNIDDIINYKQLDKNEMQKKVTEEIKSINSSYKSIGNEGYNVFVRDENSDIYKIQNTPNFFLGEDGYLYLVYAYGNNNYTSVVDLVIF